MSDNILSALLTFSLLAGGSAAIGSEMFATRQAVQAPVALVAQGMPTAPVEIVTLPAVMVTGQRAASAPIVTLPMVMVTGQRAPVTVAVETRASETSRLQ